MSQNPLSISDEELVSRILQDNELFMHLVDRYERPLRRYLNRLGRLSSHDAEDLLQDAFLKMYLNLNGFDPALKFSSWAYRITHNEAISFFRRRSHRPDLGTTFSIDDLHALSAATDLEKETDRKLESSRLAAALGQLDLKYREVIVLKFLEDKTYEEISDITKRPLGTIATLISRAKRQLKNIIQNHE